LEGHYGYINKIIYTSKYLYSASSDGCIYLWDVAKGIIVMKFYQEFAVHSIDLFPNETILAVSKNSGDFCFLDLNRNSVILEVPKELPIDENIKLQLDDVKMEWLDLYRNHSGNQSFNVDSILCSKFSPNFRFFATGSTDCTCKIWDINSLARPQSQLYLEEQISKEYENMFSVPINILNSQVEALPNGDVGMGQVPIYPGYHCDLLFSLTHEAPVTCIEISKQSDFIVTGSLDAVCRVWSLRSGILLFQVNLPIPSSCIFLDNDNNLYCNCDNKIFFFKVSLITNDAYLPLYWRRNSFLEKPTFLDDLKNLKSSKHVDFYEKIKKEAKPEISSSEEESDQETEDILKEHEDGGEEYKEFSMSDLRKMMAQGTLVSSFLEILLSQLQIDDHWLNLYMKRFRLLPRHILRALLNSKYEIKDILKTLSSKRDNTFLFMKILQGSSIDADMGRLGFKKRAVESSSDLFKIRLHYRDFQNNFGINDIEKDYQFEDEYDEGFRSSNHGGNIVHFLPSVQLRLLRG
jgi:WD40 repeat protein